MNAALCAFVRLRCVCIQIEMKNLNACAIIIHLSSVFIFFFGLPNFLYYHYSSRPLVWFRMRTYHSTFSPQLSPALVGLFLQNYMLEYANQIKTTITCMYVKYECVSIHHHHLPHDIKTQVLLCCVLQKNKRRNRVLLRCSHKYETQPDSTIDVKQMRFSVAAQWPNSFTYFILCYR